MRKASLLLMFALTVPVTAQIQKKVPPAETSATMRALIALENEWVSALQKADAATLDSILADSYGTRLSKVNVAINKVSCRS